MKYQFQLCKSILACTAEFIFCLQFEIWVVVVAGSLTSWSHSADKVLALKYHSSSYEGWENYPDLSLFYLQFYLQNKTNSYVISMLRTSRLFRWIYDIFYQKSKKLLGCRKLFLYIQILTVNGEGVKKSVVI